ncbi:hypothetical protein GL213_04415 [Halogeometricum borinquense]|uniref:Uncharacterized protein n=1 Tax=Halogeometricum borinquense TaxID=60847 RepID=A0A6C0ULG1_9EURY|nr:hypothetical protein [Halogeometricum borinquense]QIB75191.1 hypothetical protein G3I44_13415 [Halogeometricum borinquense]QIQ75833.1 hypothetical protein GL213_04415 [Halogeometricum borinquense]
MSNSSSSSVPHERFARLRELIDASPNTVRFGLKLVTYPIRFVAFWVAVALPFLYLPLLYGGLQGGQATVFASLLVLNVGALLLGHDHSRDD